MYLHVHFKQVNTSSQKGTTTPDQSGTGSNAEKEVTLRSLQLQNWNLSNGCSLEFHARHTYFFLLIRCELFYSVWHEEMLNHNTFLLLKGSELCSSFFNNSGSEFWYSHPTNIRR